LGTATEIPQRIDGLLPDSRAFSGDVPVNIQGAARRLPVEL
jgi:hypothetical protein